MFKERAIEIYDDDLTQMVQVADGHISIGPIIGLPCLVEKLGAKIEPILAELGLRADLFSHAENTMSYESVGRLAAVCAERTHCPHFGLLAAEKVGPEDLGLIGQLMTCAPDVQSALRGMILNLHLLDKGSVPTLIVHEDVAILGYALFHSGLIGAEHIQDFSLAMGCNEMRVLCGPQWVPTKVLLAHRPPEDRRPYTRFFGAPVEFDADRNALVFPATWLDSRVAGTDPALRSKLLKTMAALAQRQDDIVGAARRAVHTLILQGGCTVADVAESCAMGQRTLNRRLAERGTSIAWLMTDVRMQIAQQLLSQTRMPLAEIAATLNYADSSAFTRAFRKVASEAPSTWRQNELAAPHERTPVHG